MQTAGDWDSGQDQDQANNENHNKEEEAGWGSEVEQRCYQSASPSSTHILAGYNVEENCVDFLQVQPEKTVNASINWENLNVTSLIWMVIIKVFDLAFSLYIVGLICYCIYINSNVLLGKVSTFCIIMVLKYVLINNVKLGYIPPVKPNCCGFNTIGRRNFYHHLHMTWKFPWSFRLNKAISTNA